MKRKIQKLLKDGTPAQFRLRCGNTLTITKATSKGFYIIRSVDKWPYASTKDINVDEVGNSMLHGDIQYGVAIIISDKALPMLAKLATVLIEAGKEAR